jgi:hypothetical protein
LLFLRARSLAVSSKGKYLYVSARGEDAGVSVFSRDQQSGEHPNYTIRQLALFTRDTLTGQVTVAPDEDSLRRGFERRGDLSTATTDSMIMPTHGNGI